MICPHCHKSITEGQPNELVHFRGWGSLVRVHEQCVKARPVVPLDKDD